MTTPTCSKCRRVIPSNDFNVVQNVAYCRDCNASYRLSDLTFGNEVSANIDLNHPPKGSWFVNDGSSTIIGAINRNPVNGVGFCFSLWSGMASSPS